MKKKIGLLTGGGDCPGLNAVIRAAVRTAVQCYDFEVVGIESGFEGLMQLRTIPLDNESVRGLLPKGGTLLKTSNRGDPFSYPSEDGPVDRSALVIENIESLGIDALIVIGGDGSLTIASRLSMMGIPIVGVPKTIDNDIDATDYTFGFLTAVATATEAVDRLHSTAESHSRVMILEVMGRDAGWIALYSGLAGGADIILIPEIPFDLDVVVKSIEDRKNSGAEFDIIVIAEGATPLGGSPTYIDPKKKRLGGIAYQLADDLRTRIEMEVRVTVLGHVQRGGSPISLDRVLATRFGEAAVHLVAKGEFGKMVALQHRSIVAVPLEEAVKHRKLVQKDHDLVSTARCLGVSFGDE